jgi:tRNA threonylcarbamoyl adenosine modification protein (Sua5/YciO/YrdC/YwlC family)
VAAAASSARRGDLVVLPTESVYGVGTDAFSRDGVARLLAAKGRGRDLPLPVLVPGPGTVDGLALRLPQAGRDLITAFWPGGLTVVVRHHPSLAWDLGDTDGNVALRMPLHPVVLEVLRETGPLALTSANRAGLAPPTTCDDAEAQLGDAVRIYLDAGISPEAATSSVVDLTGDLPRLLRAGSVPLDLLREVCPDLQA